MKIAPQGSDPVFVFSPSEIVKNGMTIHCPRCSSDYIHIAAPWLQAGHDRGDASTHVRGDVARVPLLCEQCNFQVVGYLCVGFHKGQSTLWVEADRSTKGFRRMQI